MKNKSKKIIILLAICLTILMVSIGGYSYAKYKTTVKGQGQIEIARWAFNVNGNSEQLETIHFNNNFIEESELINGKIAPGTRGSFSIDIDGTGTEVGIDYQVLFQNEENKPQNLVFNYNGTEYNSLTELHSILGNISANEQDKTREITIDWIWEYETGSDEEIEANDEKDTLDGIQIGEYVFDVVVTGKQVPFARQ